MELTPMHKRVIALDVHQAKITACAVVEHDDGRVEVTKRDFGAFKRDRRALAQWSLEIRPEVVVMESTGVYWKSPFAALEAVGIIAWVVNARHVKAVPGRKTDMADAQWLATLARAGLLRASFIPPVQFRQLRLVARQRQRFCRDKRPSYDPTMIPLHVQLANSTLRGVLKRLHFPLEVMLVCVRWYAAYPLSLRNLEEMMAERGVLVDHATVHRWALKMLPVLAKVFRRRQHQVGRTWRVDETYVRVSGQWKYLYRAVDRFGQTVDFLLTARRDLAAARRFFERAINLHGDPESITIDKSGANTAAVRGLIADSGLNIKLRQSKYLNNLVEQDHRAIKRRTRPMLGFKDFGSAAKIIAGIETMHMIKKGQLRCSKGLIVSDTDRFYSLATR